MQGAARVWFLKGERVCDLGMGLALLVGPGARLVR